MAQSTISRFLGLCLAGGLLLAQSADAEPADQRPDLVISVLRLSHERAAPDSPLRVEFTVENAGHADATPFRVAVYHSDGVVVPRRGNVTRIGAVLAEKGLAAGRSATFSALVRVPPCEACRPGSIYAFADAWGSVLETSEENNFRAASLLIDRGYLPNLRVSEVRISPDRGPSGRSVELSALLENRSEFAAQGPFELVLFCSDDTDFGKPDLTLGRFRQEAVPAGSKQRITRKLEVDTRCPIRGQQVELGLSADVGGAVPESDESDNSDSATYWVFRAPDLVPGAIALSRDAGPVGSELVVSYKIKNEGKTRARPFKIGVYLSKDAKITTDDPLLDQTELDGLDATTTSGTLYQAFQVPKLATGAYFVGVVVDVEDKNGELRERNNLRAVPFRITNVNLTDRYFFVDSSSALPGAELELRFALRNRGTDTAPAFRVALYYSDDPRLDRADIRLGEQKIDKLAHGDERLERSLKVKIPTTAREGHRFLLLAIDDGDQVAEKDEYDNVALRPVRILRK